MTQSISASRKSILSLLQRVLLPVVLLLSVFLAAQAEENDSTQVTDSTLVDSVVVVPGMEVADSAFLIKTDGDTARVMLTYFVSDTTMRLVTLGTIEETCCLSVDSLDLHGTLIIPASILVKDSVFSVSAIGRGAFAQCEVLTGVRIPACVSRIDSRSFYQCRSLESVECDPSSRLTYIGDSTFQGTSLTEVKLPENVVVVGHRAFAEMPLLTRFESGDSLASVGIALFAGDTNLRYVDLSSPAIKALPDSLFAGCPMLMGIVLPDTLLAIGSYVFAGTNITDIFLPPTVTTLSPYAFASMPMLENFTGAEALTTIGGNLFADDSSLRHVDLSTSAVTHIPDSAFASCPILEQFDFPADVDTIGDRAFLGTALSEVSLPVTVRSVGHYSFAAMPKLRLFAAGDSLQTLGDGVLEGCPSLTTVLLDSASKLLVIPKCAFSQCTSLDSVLLPQELVRLGTKAFGHCAAMRQITLSNSVVMVADSVFYNCSNLRYFTAGTSLIRLGANAFLLCDSLRYINCLSASDISVPIVNRGLGAFMGVPKQCFIYLPYQGAPISEVNVITFNSSKDELACESFVIGDKTYTLSECQSGVATYVLNTMYGEQVFGQLVQVENYPLPSSDLNRGVQRLQFIANKEVLLTVYANYGSRIQAPSTFDLGLVAGVTSLTYVDENGATLEFSYRTIIKSDLDIQVKYGYVAGDVNYDGRINATDVTLIVSYILGSIPEDNTVFLIENADVNEDGEVDAKDVTSEIYIILNGIIPETSPVVTLKVLVLGNSYSCDAFGYVPYILKNIAPNVRLTIGILNHGGGSVQDIYESHVVNGEPFEFYYKRNVLGRWVMYGEAQGDLLKTLQSEKWDLIVTHQSSALSPDYDSYQPYLDSLLVWLDAHTVTPASYAWLLTPAYPAGPRLPDSISSDEMYRRIAESAQRVLNETKVSLVIPGGTAVQNARTNPSLYRLSTYGMSHDGLHLTDGIPILVEDYAVTQTLINWIRYRAYIDDDNLNVTTTWLDQNAIPQHTQFVTEFTPELIYLAKKAAKAAIQKPYEITVIDDD